VKTHCDRCGKDCRIDNYDFVLPWELLELKPPYKTRYVTHVCKICGNIANSYVNYWGQKNTNDKLALNEFLNSGPISGPLTNRLYAQLNFAGYY